MAVDEERKALQQELQRVRAAAAVPPPLQTNYHRLLTQIDAEVRRAGTGPWRYWARSHARTHRS